MGKSNYWWSMSISWTVPTEWLHNAWFKLQKTDVRSQISVDGTYVVVTAFAKGGAGMRVSKYRIEKTGKITFEVSDALRCFIKKCLPFHSIDFCVENEQMVLKIDQPGLGIQYTFSKIKIVEENVIPDQKEDQHMSISSRDWFCIWPTIPPKGDVTLSISKQSKIMTLKHSGGRWGGAITLKNKPKRDQTIKIDPIVAKSVFVGDVSEAWSTVVFMKVGVLQWFTSDMTIYVAPIE